MKIRDNFCDITSSSTDQALIFEDGKKTYIQTYEDIFNINNSLNNKWNDVSKNYNTLFKNIRKPVLVAIDVSPDFYLPALFYNMIKSEKIFFPISMISMKKSVMIRASVKLLIVHKQNFTKLNDTSFIDNFKIDVICDEFTPNHLLVYVDYESVCDMSISNNVTTDHAYMLSTSGTTGNGKLVVVTHDCIMHNLNDLRSIFQVKKSDVILIPSSLTFDASLLQMLLALSMKATMLMITNNILQKPDCLSHMINKNATTIIQCTPSLLMHMGVVNLKKHLFYKETSLRILALGGERFLSKQIYLQLTPSQYNIKVFNIYGITENSAWATIQQIEEYHMTQNDGNSLDGVCKRDWVPIGDSLSHTFVKLDYHGDGDESGEILIGSEERKCFIENVEYVQDCYLRTGDIGTIYNNKIYYSSRKNNLIKRHGQIISLDTLESTLSSVGFLNISSITVVYDANELKLFVMKSTCCQNFMIIKAKIIRYIKSNLSNIYIPDRIIFIDYLPLTEHGKIDRKNLLTAPSKNSNYEINCEVLDNLWKNVLSLDTAPNENDQFVFNGGDSFTAVFLANEITEQFDSINEGTYEILLRKMLHETYKDVIDYVFKQSPLSNKVINDQIIVTVHKHIFISNYESIKVNENVKTRLRETYCLNDSRASHVTGHVKNDLVFKESWRTDLKKCIDATPLVITDEHDDGVVYIGSHSHLFSAICLKDGRIIWQRLFPSRIESSAAITPDLKFVGFGCYDGHFYVLHAENGQTYWSFKTNDQIKSTPIILSYVQPSIALAFIGSHDYYLYALDLLSRCLVWKLYGGASCISSPLVRKEKLFTGFLDGKIICCKLNSGKVYWQQNLKKSIFSNLYASELYLLCACVDGNIYAMDYGSGNINWKFETFASIFSSPIAMKNSLNNQENIFIGSNDHNLYCLNNQGLCNWKFKGNSPFYSTSTFLGNKFIVSVTTKGSMYVIDVHTGEGQLVYQFPGKMFSSPIFVNGKIVIGCRDNYLFCIQCN